MSWVEVEAKIKVTNPIETRKKIKKIAHFVKREHKIDDYYTLHPHDTYPKKSLRIRDKGKVREVNFKQRLSYKHGIWAKRETEFTVSDLRGFYDLLEDFGFKKWLRKEKKTELYRTKSGVDVEFNEVKGLGWFIELEVKCRENLIAIALARRKILRVMQQLNVQRKDIEKKGYTRVLWQLKHK